MNSDDHELLDEIVDCAINAAQRAVEEAKFDAADEVGLNEAWIQSFVSTHLNDLLRQRFSQDKVGIANGDVFSIIEKRASWIDRSHNGDVDYNYDMSGSRKFDLCLWSSDAPICLIEIKHNDIALWGKQADLEKIIRSVLRWPGLRFSTFLFSARVAPEQVEKDISSTEAKLLKFIDKSWFGAYSLYLKSCAFRHQPQMYWHAITASRHPMRV